MPFYSKSSGAASPPLGQSQGTDKVQNMIQRGTGRGGKVGLLGPPVKVDDGLPEQKPMQRPPMSEDEQAALWSRQRLAGRRGSPRGPMGPPMEGPKPPEVMPGNPVFSPDPSMSAATLQNLYPMPGGMPPAMGGGPAMGPGGVPIEGGMGPGVPWMGGRGPAPVLRPMQVINGGQTPQAMPGSFVPNWGKERRPMADPQMLDRRTRPPKDRWV